MTLSFTTGSELLALKDLHGEVLNLEPSGTTLENFATVKLETGVPASDINRIRVYQLRTADSETG